MYDGYLQIATNFFFFLKEIFIKKPFKYGILTFMAFEVDFYRIFSTIYGMRNTLLHYY